MNTALRQLYQGVIRAAPGELVALQGLRMVPSRRRCGTLPWEALVAALG